jgi:hypothetical protein
LTDLTSANKFATSMASAGETDRELAWTQLAQKLVVYIL